MPKKYIIDTCVWRDFYENRTSSGGKPLGDYASEMFVRIIRKNRRILFSEALAKELGKDYSLEEIYNMLNLLFSCNVLLRIEISREEYLEARKLSRERNIPFIDCLNAVQARNHGAIIISQDRHFREKLSDIAETLKPQDVT